MDSGRCDRNLRKRLDAITDSEKVGLQRRLRSQLFSRVHQHPDLKFEIRSPPEQLVLLLRLGRHPRLHLVREDDAEAPVR